MEGLLNESPTYDTSNPTRSHRETKCWPVVSCELIGSAAICIYSYRMQCCRPYHHTPHNHHIQETHTQQAGTLFVWHYRQDLTGLMKVPLMIQVTLLDLTERPSVGQWFHVN